MELLNPIPQCIDCLLSLVRDVTLMAAPDNLDLAEKTESVAREIIAEAEINPTSSPQVANRILREVRRLSGVNDPFAEFKAREMDQARQIVLQLESQIGTDLRSRVSLALLGNSLDFFNDPQKVLADIPRRKLKDFSYFQNDTDQLEIALHRRPETVVYLTDNAGEVYFDRPLYDYLQQRSRKAILAVKGGPALNDLTREELKAAGLEDAFEAVTDTGTDGAGIDWENVSTDFLDLITSADIVISKGMANFETLYARDMAAPVFFLFKVKCEPIHNYIQAPGDSFMALWKKGS
jgi:uncharacterized protein with ATP-grasp and redox domains